MSEMAIQPVTRTFEDFCDALDDVVDRWRESQTITRAEAVGALEFVKQKILHEAFEEQDE